ncbi:hypothetical protein ONZ43_g5898 [Nemania bipapillata]|uniref:Uncharacterized protein n=1 Tax=Nemania bipapillata TaxID=110536 RepID=A0ACC2I4L0_9PEZI|nr:hypothetical protein ONZ43_g5898 [Nemania bipapillata]
MDSAQTKDPASQCPQESHDNLPEGREGSQDITGALELERSRREGLESELRQTQEESLKFQKLWKKAARDLNQYKTKNKGIEQLTDDYLIDQANGLRYNIKNFAVHVGTETAPPPPPPMHNGPIEGDGISTSTLSPEATSALPQTGSTTASPSANHCQAKIWRYLEGYVFGKFVWAMPITQEILKIEEVLLSQIGGEQSPSSVEKRRKLRLWRANTANLILDAMPPVAEEWRDRKMRMAQEIYNSLGLTPLDDMGSIEQEIITLLDQAVDLDKDISQQVSEVYWHFGDDSNLESLERDESGNSVHAMVIAPGMIRCGTSSGDRLDVQNELLPIERGLGDERICKEHE